MLDIEQNEGSRGPVRFVKKDIKSSNLWKW
jgi:hypothetical protein